jgi:hypothetical protein
MSTSSEEFRKFVKRLLYEDTSKTNFQTSTKSQIFERALTLKKHRIMHQQKTILQNIRRYHFHTRKFYIKATQLIDFFIKQSTIRNNKAMLKIK